MFFSGGSQGGDNVALTMGASMSGLGENPCPCCELTLMQRLTGFASCFGIGMLISFLSTMSLWGGNYTQFAVLYSVGNTIALLSMGFLMGPKSQCKNMFAETRRIATGVYLALIIVTLGVGIGYEGNGKLALVLLCVFAQFFALCWYTLSYIPFARTMVLNCFQSCLRG